jgi:hypothetical protein
MKWIHYDAAQKFRGLDGVSFEVYFELFFCPSLGAVTDGTSITSSTSSSSE